MYACVYIYIYIYIYMYVYIYIYIYIYICRETDIGFDFTQQEGSLMLIAPSHMTHRQLLFIAATQVSANQRLVFSSISDEPSCCSNPIGQFLPPPLPTTVVGFLFNLLPILSRWTFQQFNTKIICFFFLVASYRYRKKIYSSLST